MTPRQARHDRDGYTVGIYFPPAAPWDAVEAFFDRAAEDAYGIDRTGWDASVVGLPGDQLDIGAEDPLDEQLREARLWARHGYEIAQRSCTWSDHGVAPSWLTEGIPAPSADRPTAKEGQP